MTLAEPINLLAALIVPLLAGLWALERRRRRRFAVRYPAAPVVAAVMARTSAWRRRVPPALLALSALALAVALARPQATVAVPVEKASTVLVTDESGSMRAEDVSPSRLAAAQSAAHTFLDSVPDSLLVGFVSYSTGTRTMLEPTDDHAAIAAAVDGLEADGGTATGDALSAALDRLEARKDDRGRMAPGAIVLLSDGKTTEGSDPLEAARRAAQLRIPVHTVALGTEGGEVPAGPMGQMVPVPPDRETLREIARVSGGTAFEVEDADQLSAVYEDLGSRIGTKEERREVSAMFAGGALLLLVAGAGAALRWRGRLP